MEMSCNSLLVNIHHRIFVIIVSSLFKGGKSIFKERKILKKGLSMIEKDSTLYLSSRCHIDPFKPEFTIVIFIHSKQRIAIAILDL